MAENFIGRKFHWLKISYDDVISTVNDFFDQLDPSTKKPIGEVCGQRACWNINLI